MRRPAVCFSGAFGLGILMTFLLEIQLYIILLSATGALIFAVCSYLYKLKSYIKSIALILSFVLV